jgi:short-subunit dehydrogenase
MAKTILVAGFGSGISRAVAEKFAHEGFGVALVARNAEGLDTAVKELTARGVRAAAFPADLSDPAAARSLAGRVRERLGPITVLHWNAYAGAGGDLLTADAPELRRIFDVPVTSLVQAVQGALPDLRGQKDAAILVTNGGLGVLDPAMDAVAANSNSMGLALANAVKHKLVRVLSAKLAPEGVYVGEVMVLGLVKGTAWDKGNATVDASTVAQRFWDLYGARNPVSVNVS